MGGERGRREGGRRMGQAGKVGGGEWGGVGRAAQDRVFVFIPEAMGTLIRSSLSKHSDRCLSISKRKDREGELSE